MRPLYPEVQNFIKELPRTHPVPARRQAVLKQIAEFVFKKLQKDEVAELVFICTHNSRRSQLAQVWATIALHYHGLDNVLCFSGGTEITAVHQNVINILEMAGCTVEKPGGKNPVYLIKFAQQHKGVQAFSKKYSDRYNPSKGFCAILTCAEADEKCPVVLGMEKRVSLTYEDPQVADRQPNQESVYLDRCRQIAMEMFFMVGQVNTFYLR